MQQEAVEGFLGAVYAAYPVRGREDGWPRTGAEAEALLATLEEWERRLLERFFGLDGNGRWTYAEIAASEPFRSHTAVENAKPLLLRRLAHLARQRAAQRQWQAATTDSERLAVPAVILDVPIRVENTLQRERVATLCEVVSRTELDWLDVRQFGPVQLDALKAALAALDPPLCLAS